jgi:hypothetical protein
MRSMRNMGVAVGPDSASLERSRSDCHGVDRVDQLAGASSWRIVGRERGQQLDRPRDNDGSGEEESIIDSVNAKFALSDVDTTRFSVILLSFCWGSKATNSCITEGL